MMHKFDLMKMNTIELCFNKKKKSKINNYVYFCFCAFLSALNSSDNNSNITIGGNRVFS